MIYVPMMKNRMVELSVVTNVKDCFSNKIIPLLEIIKDIYESRYKIDPVSNDFVYEKRGKTRRRVKEISTEEDIITLKHINSLVEEKQVFIDYFRFTIEKYGNRIDIANADLALRLSRDEEFYKNRIKDISRFPNMIPVISIKKGFDMNKTKLKEFLGDLQKENNSVALRITEEWLAKYKDIFKNVLRKSDYLLFDICEQNPESKFMELEELSEIESNAKTVLLNSPRKASIKNGEYSTHGTTDLINNCARFKAEEYRLRGYGDYCGLKDVLPSRGGSHGTGAALALFYDYNKNIFYSYMNSDTSLGIRGYEQLIPIIIADKAILDKNNECPAFNKVENMNTTGHWTTWHNINATRYIHQVHKCI